MGTKHADIFAALMAPFAAHEVKQRAGSGGRQLSYVTAATVSNRLDEVLGPEAWDFDIRPWKDDALIGTITIRLPDGTVVKKSNVGGSADMQASDDDAKSTASDCLKRCATMFGVARYLSRDGVPSFAQVSDHRDPGAPPPGKGEAYEGGERHRDNIPWGGPREAAGRDRTQAPRGDGGPDKPPRTGKALFAWLRRMEEEHGVQLLLWVNGLVKQQRLGDRIVDLGEREVAVVYAETMRKLQELEPVGAHGEPDEA